MSRVSPRRSVGLVWFKSCMPSHAMRRTSKPLHSYESGLRPPALCPPTERPPFTVIAWIDCVLSQSDAQGASRIEIYKTTEAENPEIAVNCRL